MGNEKTQKASALESTRPLEKHSDSVSYFEPTAMMGAPIQQLSTVQRLHGLIGNQAVQRLIAQAPTGNGASSSILESNPSNTSVDPTLLTPDSPNVSVDPNIPAPVQTPGTQPNVSVDPNAPAPVQTPGTQPNVSVDPNAPALVQTPSTQPNVSVDPNAPAPVQTPGTQPNMSDPNAPAPVQTPGTQPNVSVDPNAPAPVQTPDTQPNVSVDPNVPAPVQTPGNQPNMSVNTATPGNQQTGNSGPGAPNNTSPQTNEPDPNAQPADPQAAAPGGTPSSLVNSELAEHQRWGKVGAAESASRALFIADSIGKGEMQGLKDGAIMGAATGVGTRAALFGVGKAVTKWGPLISKNASKFTPVPAVGAIIGGAFAVHGLVTRNWAQSWSDIKGFGKGEGDYEPIANTLQSIATVLEIVAGIASSIAGVLGLISAGMWIGAILTAGALSPLAATLSSIAGIISVVTNVVDLVNQTILQPAIVLFRALQTFKSQSDPENVAKLGIKLSESAAGPAAALGSYVGAKGADKVSDKAGAHYDKRQAAKAEADAKPDTDVTPAKDGPEITAKEPLPPVDENAPAAPVAEADAPAPVQADADAPTSSSSDAPGVKPDEGAPAVTVDADAPTATKPADAPPGTEWPMASTQGKSLDLSYPNTAPAKNGEAGVSEKGGAFRYESGDKPPGDHPFKDLTDAEIDAALVGLDAHAKNQDAPAGTAEAGPFQQVDIAAFEPNMPYTQKQLDAMTPERRALKEGIDFKADDKPTIDPVTGKTTDRGYDNPLSPPAKFGYDTPGASADGSHHGATGNTTKNDKGEYQYNPAEVMGVTPNKKTYAVRGGKAGSYVDHIFNTKAEAVAYAEMMSKRSEAQIREESAIKKAWNDLDAFRIFEVPENTPFLRSSIAPQAETAPGYPSRYEGGGPQIQLPYGTAHGDGMAQFPIKDRVPQPGDTPEASTTPKPDAPPASPLPAEGATVVTDAAPSTTPVTDVPEPIMSVPVPDPSTPAPKAPDVPVSDGAPTPVPAADAPTSSTPDTPAPQKPPVDPNSRVGKALAKLADWGGGEGSLETSQKAAAAKKKLEETLPKWSYTRPVGYRPRSFAKWLAKGEMAEDREDEEKRLREAEAQRKIVTVPVTPNYTPPPGTPADVQSLDGEICALESKEDQAARMQSTAAREVKTGEKNQSTMEDVVADTTASIANTQQHALETDNRTQTNQKAAEKQAETQKTTQGFGERTAGLGTLKAMLNGFLGMMHVVSYIPSDTAKNAAKRMGGDARKFLANLNQADTAVSGVNSGHGARKTELQQDKQALTQTKTQNAQTGQKLTTAKDGAVALQQQNIDRTDNAQQVQERAAEQRSQIKKDTQQRRDQKEDLSQKIAAWAQGHQDSRKEAATETQAQLVAQGYEINEVKNV